MQKIMKVSVIETTKKDMSKLYDLNIIYDSYIHNGYNGIILYDKAYICNDIKDENKKIKILVNSYQEINLGKKIHENEFKINSVNNNNLPSEFGLSTDTNVNVQLLNYDITKFENDFNVHCYGWIDIDGIRYCGNEYMKIPFETIHNIFDKKGFYSPLICYVDDIVQIIDKGFVYAFSKLFGLKYMPVIFLTYTDIKYIKKINQNLYDKLLKLKTHKYYQRYNDVDYTEYFITNYSDKRTLLYRYVNKYRVKDTSTENFYSRQPLHAYKQILPFFFKDEKYFLNDKLIDKIMNIEYPPIIYIDHKIYTRYSLGMELKTYVQDFARRKEITLKNKRFFNLSDYKIENYDMKNLLTANLIYNDTTDMIDNDKSIYVLEEVPYQILNFFNITEEMLVNDSLEIKKLCQLTSI